MVGDAHFAGVAIIVVAAATVASAHAALATVVTAVATVIAIAAAIAAMRAAFAHGPRWRAAPVLPAAPLPLPPLYPH